MALNRKFKNLVLFSGALFVSLLAAEIYLRWNPPVGVYMAVRNIVQQTHSENSSNQVLGYVPRAGLVKPFKNREFNTTVKINSRNMRGEEYSVEKPSGVKRIAAMGDSFVFGWGVENEEIFTAILEKELLKNTEVLNFGVSGYAAYQELERLEKEALKFQPDIVLFFLYGIPEVYDEPGIFAEEPPLSLKKKMIRFLEKYSYLLVLIQEARGAIRVTKAMMPEPETGILEIEQGWKVLKSLKDLGLKHDFLPIVVYIPLKQEAREGKSADAAPIAAYCSKESLPFLDLTRALHRSWTEGKPPYFRIDDHWTREGHRVAALAIAQFLNENSSHD